MPRPHRFRLVGFPLHVVQRGLDQRAVFFENQDRRFYLSTLAESAAAYGVVVHSYCLMTNHVHVLATPTEPGSMSRTMQRLGREYVMYINRRSGRRGTLWDGRYRACLVDSDRYLLACSRYIELNPVRAGIVDTPAAWPWSSYRCTALGQPDDLISHHEVYRALGDDPSSRAQQYRDLFTDALPDETLEALRNSVNRNHVLGDGRFRDQIEAMLQRRIGNGSRGRPGHGTGPRRH